MMSTILNQHRFNISSFEAQTRCGRSRFQPRQSADVSSNHSSNLSIHFGLEALQFTFSSSSSVYSFHLLFSSYKSKASSMSRMFPCVYLATTLSTNTWKQDTHGLGALNGSDIAQRVVKRRMQRVLL
ncbi:hypothetical protein PsorP6_006855 [Peronosclerospora sorghi]|uniref:Uncharacterized protein n=1 Tax=Peronosclerospora sorghi TaxID=230839 RepID=A0ACC0WA48_9STRA|nr:hypothetical protein PsorP6_006855 [Peronosclerospora sorghi]